MTGKLRLGLAILARYVRVRRDLARLPLPEIVARYARLLPAQRRHQVRTLRRGVERLLVLPGRPLRCLPRALVLYSMVVEQGHHPRLIVGLSPDANSNRAHAWVEIDGIDVGPAPGRNGHEALAAYPLEWPGASGTS